jgi:CCR4-NOT transcriptional complex subunit CAF120
MNEGGQTLQNVLSISTAANNRYLLHFNSLNSLTQWTAGIRLALFEHTTLQEAYTGSLVAGKGKQLNNIRQIMDRNKAVYEDWARVRFGAGTPWRRCWCRINPPDEKEYQKKQKAMKKKSPYEKTPILKGDLKFYDTKKIGKRTRPIATITDAWSAYALYPQSKPLIDQSTLVKIEGRITIHSSPESVSDGFIFVMPETHPAVSGFEMMLRFLFPLWDTFNLYGRPNRLIADVRDVRGLMFALPKDRRYGYLEILDVAGLIHTEGSQTWNERKWRKEMKDLTSKRMLALADDPIASRHSSIRQNTATRTSFPSTQGGMHRLEESTSGRFTPSPAQESSSHQRNNQGSPADGGLRHRRSASEAYGAKRQNQTPSQLNQVTVPYTHDETPPQPPPHGARYQGDYHRKGTPQEHYETASEGNEHEYKESAEISVQTALPEIQRAASPEPVSPPPSFGHGPSQRPTVRPNLSPELRRGHSNLDGATLSQMAEATNMHRTESAPDMTAFYDEREDSVNGQDEEHDNKRWSGNEQGGTNTDASQRATPSKDHFQGYMSSKPRQQVDRLATIPASPFVQQSESSPVAQSVITDRLDRARVQPQIAAFSTAPKNATSEVTNSHPNLAFKQTNSHPVSQTDGTSPYIPYDHTTTGPALSKDGFGLHRKPIDKGLPTSSNPNRALAGTTFDDAPMQQPPPPPNHTERLRMEKQKTVGGDPTKREITIGDTRYSLASPSPFPNRTERPRMGKQKIVGSVDLVNEDILIGDARYTPTPPGSSDENGDLPRIDFGPTYSMDPTKRHGPPPVPTKSEITVPNKSDITVPNKSDITVPNKSEITVLNKNSPRSTPRSTPRSNSPANSKSNSPVYAGRNRSASSLSTSIPNHSPSGSQTQLPLRGTPIYAYNQPPSASSASPQQNLRPTSSSGKSILGPGNMDRESQHSLILAQLESLTESVGRSFFSEDDMQDVRYDSMNLPRILAEHLQQFRPRPSEVLISDDARERRERAVIFQLRQTVKRIYEDQQQQMHKRVAKAYNEAPPITASSMPPSQPQHPYSQTQSMYVQQQPYPDPRYVDALQQQVRTNPQAYGGQSARPPHQTYSEISGKQPNSRGPTTPPLSASHQQRQSIYGQVNPYAGYTQEEAMRAGRYGPAPSSQPSQQK